MVLIKDTDIIKKAIPEAAKNMVIAAITAPKARGMNNISAAIITEDDIHKLAAKMNQIGENNENKIFLRDARNVLDNAAAVVLIGCKINPAGLQICGLCGFKNCDEKNNYPDTPCTFNTTDLGIALGSAVSLASDLRIDNRIMYTIGIAAKEINYLGSEYKIVFGIPLSASSKNPFFDRK